MLYLTLKNKFLMIALDIDKDFFAPPKENFFSLGHVVYSVFLIAKGDPTWFNKQEID